MELAGWHRGGACCSGRGRAVSTRHQEDIQEEIAQHHVALGALYRELQRAKTGKRAQRRKRSEDNTVDELRSQLRRMTSAQAKE